MQTAGFTLTAVRVTDNGNIIYYQGQVQGKTVEFSQAQLRNYGYNIPPDSKVILNKTEVTVTICVTNTNRGRKIMLVERK